MADLEVLAVGEVLLRLPVEARAVVEAELRSRSAGCGLSVGERAVERAEMAEGDARRVSSPGFRSVSADIATRVF